MVYALKKVSLGSGIDISNVEAKCRAGAANDGGDPDLSDVLEAAVLRQEEEDAFEACLAAADAVERIRLVVDRFGAKSVTVLTSFGVQSGVMLSLVAEACPDIRVLYIDTQGPTSERDLRYGRQLLEILGLGDNLAIAKADVTRDDFREAMGEVGITPEYKPDFFESDSQNIYRKLSQNVFKINPLKQECTASKVQCLLSGVRRGQTSLRDHLNFVQFSSPGGGDPSKAHPILDWTDERCLEHLQRRNMPRHPEMDSIVEEIVLSKKEEDEVPMVALSDDGSSASEEDKKDDEDPPTPTGERPGLPHRSSSLLRSRRYSRGNGMECGIHVQRAPSAGGDENDPVPPLPNVVVTKAKCKFCVAAKTLLHKWDVEYVEAPLSMFSHLVPPGTKTVPVVYLNGQLIGGYGDLCDHLGVEDTVNNEKEQ